MPDTGAPWNIPYVEATDLVRDWPTDSEALADAIADGLDAAGGLVAVKSAIFTGTQTNSTAASANFAISGLSITHEVADVANKLIISAFIGAASNSAGQRGNVGLAVYDGSNLLSIGNASSSRTRVTAGGSVNATGNSVVATMPSVTFVHTPGLGSKTYTLRAVNITGSTGTIYINRDQLDNNSGDRPRAVSSLVIQEVRV